MRNLVKTKKKKGFTLIEMVAVVAIIGILAAILVPKITGYMKEAKKTGVIDQARKVVQAYETAKMKDKLATDQTPEQVTMNHLDDIATVASLLDHPETDITATLDKLPAAVTVKDCIDIVEKKTEFTVGSNGVLLRIDGMSGDIDQTAINNTPTPPTPPPTPEG